MANYANLKAAISAAIKTNGNQEITGQVLQDVLNSMVSVIGANYTFAGVATPATNPGTPDQNVMYLAMEGGTYTNFNGTVLPAGISLLMWNGTWTSETVMYGDGGVFDISVYKSTGGTLATFADLADALDGGNNIPASARKGGMSVKFVQSSDNKYVQYRLMANTFSTTESDWQGIDDVPTDTSENLVESGGVSAVISANIAQLKQKKWDITNTGKYINKNNGNEVNYESGIYTDFIPCFGNQTFYCYVWADSNIGVCFYDQNKKYIIGYNAAQENLVSPPNAFFVRASSRYPAYRPYIKLVSANKVLEDIPDPFISSVWEQYSNSSADEVDEKYYSNGVNYTRKDVYNTIRDIKLIGFDSTKKHTLHVLWSETDIFSFRISAYNTETSTWEVVYNYIVNTYTPIDSFTFDKTIDGKRVIALFDFNFAMPGYGPVFNPLNTNPEYIFAGTCFYDKSIVAGKGISISGDVISFDAETADVQEVIIKGENGLYDIPESAFNISGFISKTGVLTTHAQYKCTDFLLVMPGLKYHTNAIAIDNAVCCYYDITKTLLSYFSLPVSGIGNDFTVPENARYIRMSNNSTTAHPYAKVINAEYLGLKELTRLAVNTEAQKRPVNRIEKLYPQTKLPCISFQFDDIPDKDSEIVALFESYMLRCGFAFVASQGNIEQKADYYLNLQEKGFSILNHSVDGKIFNTTNYTYSTALSTIMTAKNRIENAGMVVNGFVAPSSEMASDFLPILKLSHCYAFTTATSSPTANGREQDTCQLHRYSMQSHTLAEIEQYIDDCITKDQIMTFYGHAADLVDEGDTTVFSIAKIAAIIEYCIAKRDGGLLYIGNTDDCVKYFFDL